MKKIITFAVLILISAFSHAQLIIEKTDKANHLAEYKYMGKIYADLNRKVLPNNDTAFIITYPDDNYYLLTRYASIDIINQQNFSDLLALISKMYDERKNDDEYTVKLPGANLTLKLMYDQQWLAKTVHLFYIPTIGPATVFSCSKQILKKLKQSL